MARFRTRSYPACGECDYAVGVADDRLSSAYLLRLRPRLLSHLSTSSGRAQTTPPTLAIG